MNRFFPSSVCATFLLLVASFASVAAGASRDIDISPQELESLERQLITMLPQLSGTETERPVFRRHREGLYSLTLALSEEQNRELAQSVTGDGLYLLAVGQQTSIPSNPSFLSNSAMFRPSTMLNFWWAVYNSGAEDVTARTVLRVKGGGRTLVNETAELEYPQATFTLYWEGTRESLDKAGLYMTKVIVQSALGGRSRKTHFVVKN